MKTEERRRLRLGDRVRRSISCLNEKAPSGGRGPRREDEGAVIYVHPLGRHYTVEFDLPGGPVRENYPGRRRG